MLQTAILVTDYSSEMTNYACVFVELCNGKEIRRLSDNTSVLVV